AAARPRLQPEDAGHAAASPQPGRALTVARAFAFRRRDDRMRRSPGEATHMTEPTATRIAVRGCGILLGRAGAGRPLLFLPVAGDAGVWPPCLDDLAARHDVLVPEHPGFGASDTPAWLDTIADLANFYLDLIDQLDLAEIDLVGHDLGGWIAA